MGSWIVDNWITCVECGKWRMLPLTLSQVELDNLPEFWSCRMNQYDKQRSTCSAPEMDKAYMEQWYKQVEQLKMKQKAMNLDFGKLNLSDESRQDDNLDYEMQMNE